MTQPKVVEGQPPIDRDNVGIPLLANTDRPDQPFYVDITGLNFGDSDSPPTRTSAAPSYPKAPVIDIEADRLPKASGSFILRASRHAALGFAVDPDVPTGSTVTFTMTSAESRIYADGWVRDEEERNSAFYSARVTPGDPSALIIDASRPGPWTRTISVYVPAGYQPGTQAPFMVAGDGGVWSGYVDIAPVLDTLIHRKRIPPIIFIEVGNGGQDAQGSQRSREYDTVSAAHAQFIQHEVLPLVEAKAGVQLTDDPKGRAAMGISSSGAAAFTMAWFHPEWFSRVLAFSPTMVNQQWPKNPALPGGAWQFHSPYAGHSNDGTSVEPLILDEPPKPIRIWFTNGDRDNFYPNAHMADGMHDWTLGAHNFARALAARNYEYQWLFALDGAHFDVPLMKQIIPHALEWLWQE